MKAPKQSLRLTRRSFLRTSAAGVVLPRGPSALGQATERQPSDTIHVAVIGCGQRGTELAGALHNFPGVKFHAATDPREGSRLAIGGRYGVESFERAEQMLEKKGREIDACIVAVPDGAHETVSVTCLRAGKALYCEAALSNTIEGARRIVRAQKETGKLMQAGHHQRSDRRGETVRNALMERIRLAGDITHLRGVWSQGVRPPLRLRQDVADQVLGELGYGNWHEFVNWRNFKKHGGGPWLEQGARMLDLFNWLMDATPVSVTAAGGIDYYMNRRIGDGPPVTWEHFDNVVATYEYRTQPWGTVRAVVEVIATSSFHGRCEEVKGTKGVFTFSEDPEIGKFTPHRDNYEVRELIDAATLEGKLGNPIEIGKDWEGTPFHTYPVRPDSPGNSSYRYHLANFFDVLRKGGEQNALNCPVMEAFKACVAVLKAEESVRTGRKYVFRPEDFEI